MTQTMPQNQIPSLFELITGSTLVVGAVLASLLHATPMSTLEDLFFTIKSRPDDNPEQEEVKTRLKFRLIVMTIHTVAGSIGSGIVCALLVFASGANVWFAIVAGILGAMPGWPLLTVLSRIFIKHLADYGSKRED